MPLIKMTLRMLPVRLEKKRPGIVMPFFFALVMCAAGAGLIVLGTQLDEVKGAWLMAASGVIAAVLSVVMLWSCFYQLLMRRIPLPVVELSAQPIVAGKPARLAVIQPGPVQLRCLRLEIVCLERHIKWEKRAPDAKGHREIYSKIDEKRVHTETLVDATDATAPAGEVWQQTCEFMIPATAQPTKESNRLDVVWQIEVSGRGGPLTKFVHKFVIDVRRG
jgi:hypothetical protein